MNELFMWIVCCTAVAGSTQVVVKVNVQITSRKKNKTGKKRRKKLK